MADVEEVLRAFLEDRPWLTEPGLVHDRCADVSASFMDYLQDEGLDARLISGFRTGEFMGQSVIENAHMAVLVQGTVYDWTARQFDPDADVPLVISEDDFRAEWPTLTTKET